MQPKHKARYLFNIGKIITQITLMVCVAPSLSYAGETMCKNLKPFNNLDELLYQFYINLDSDCLFKIPVDDLEKVWGIKILSHERLSSGQYLSELREGADFKNKLYQSEADAFYIEARSQNNNRSFSIKITNYYYDKYGTLFPEGNFPKLLPTPLQEPQNVQAKPIKPKERKPEAKRQINRGVYLMDSYSYFWLSSNNRHRIILTGQNGVTGVVIF